jgi:putative ABC transport system permease protein
MKVVRLAWIAFLRDAKAGELRVLGLALIVAVTALTAVGFFTNRVSRAVDQQAGEVLAGDLRLQSSNQLSQTYLTDAHRRGLSTAEVASFPSVILHNEASALCAIRAVSSTYPLRGHVKITDAPFGTPYEVRRTPTPGEVWPEARVLAMLQLQVGDALKVGKAALRITHVLEYRPDQGSQFVDFAPTVLISMEDLAKTELIQPGSRITYSALFAGSPSTIAQFKSDLTARKKMGERLSDIADASPQIRSAIDRAGRFLNLAALVTIFLACVAVAISARRYVARHLDAVALMKSLGASQRFVLSVSVVQLLIVAIAAGIAGSIIGYLAEEAITLFLRGLLRGELPAPSLSVAWVGIVTSVLVLTGFALPSLLQLRRVPPARVLRRNLEPPPLRYVSVYGTALLALVALLGWLLRDAKLLGYVLLAAIVTFAILTIAGWILVRLLSRLRGRVGVAWRYGIANIARRGRDSIAQVVAFGLGLMVLLLLILVRNDLMAQWRASLPKDAPNYFLINIRPDEGDQLQKFFTDRSVAPPRLVPMMRAHLTGINDQPVAKLKLPSDRGRDFVDREANLTWAEDLQPDNKIVAGSWWKPNDDGGPRVSVENELAQALGLKVGDRLTYDVAGEPITATVASLRQVQWDSFRPNFFMVFSPGVLDAATGTYVTSVHLLPEQKPMLLEFMRTFPEVTTIDLDAILSQVRGVMDKASTAVRYVFAFTLLAGITVLLAAIQATRDERRHESAMLRTLGAKRSTVLQGVAAEFIALGLLSGVLAAAGATLGGYLLATRVLDLKYHFDPLLWIVGLLAGAVLVGVSGTLATRSVVEHSPLETLRRT